MSRQINFFADSEDTAALHQRLLEVFPDLSVVVNGRGPLQELHPIEPRAAFENDARQFLVPMWARDRLCLEQIQTHVYWLNPRTSPVIEYKPCRVVEDANTVRRGRLYWSYEGTVCPEAIHQIDRIFRWIRKHTQPIPPDGRFRVFEYAARNRRYLDFDFDIIQPSPEWRA